MPLAPAKEKTPIRPKQATSKPQTKPDANVQLDNPSQLDMPAFLMNFPFSFDADSPNNAWMVRMSTEEREPDFQLAYRQFMDLYQQIAGESLVYLLPSKPTADLQDLVYVANIGQVICHTPKPVFVAANFKSPPRKGEEEIGIRFFKDMDYEIKKPPKELTWEGVADTKPIRTDNGVAWYIGGYGQRTNVKVYDWFEKTFPPMKVIRVKMTDPLLYHGDCLFAPLTSDTMMVCTSQLDKREIAEIEKVCDILPVSTKLAHAAITNIIRVGSFIVFGSTLPGLTTKDKDYDDECDKMAWMEKNLPKLGLDPVAVNLSEYEKSGAAASCMACPLNFSSFAVPLM